MKTISEIAFIAAAALLLTGGICSANPTAINITSQTNFIEGIAGYIDPVEYSHSEHIPVSDSATKFENGNSITISSSAGSFFANAKSESTGAAGFAQAGHSTWFTSNEEIVKISLWGKLAGTENREPQSNFFIWDTTTNTHLTAKVFELPFNTTQFTEKTFSDSYTLQVEPGHEYLLRLESRVSATSPGTFYSELNASVDSALIPAPTAILLATLALPFIRKLKTK